MLVAQKLMPLLIFSWPVLFAVAGVKWVACFTVLQMKKHPEALNYSWDGSRQTLNSTWGNPAVTLQLILLLNPAAECVCVSFLCFVYLSKTCSDEVLTRTHSHTDYFKPTNSMCQENNKFPLLLMLNSGRLIWHMSAHTWLSIRTCTCYKNIAVVAEVKRRV